MSLDDIKVNLKRFFSNPNTLTFLLVLVLIVITYFIYSYTINKAVKPVTIPYANKLLMENELIDNSYINTVSVSGTYISGNSASILQNRNFIVNHRVNEGYQIVKNSFFYTDAVTSDANTTVDTYYKDLPDNYTIYTLKVSFHSTYGNSIMSGNYIDLYLKAKDENGNWIFKPFIKSIKVFKVLDSDYNDVFTTVDDSSQANPTYMYFSVPLDQYQLLKQAELISSSCSLELVPVPRNAGYSETPKETEIVDDSLVDFITSKVALIS